MYASPKSSSPKNLVTTEPAVIVPPTPTVIANETAVIILSENEKVSASSQSAPAEVFENLVREFGTVPNFITFIVFMVLLICGFIVACFYITRHCCCPNFNTPRQIREMRTRLVSFSSPLRLLFNSPTTEQNENIEMRILNADNSRVHFINNHDGGSPRLRVLHLEDDTFYTPRGDSPA